MGEPGAHPRESGTAASEEEAKEAAMRALRQRPDYASILALAKVGLPVDVYIFPASPNT